MVFPNLNYTLQVSRQTSRDWLNSCCVYSASRCVGPTLRGGSGNKNTAKGIDSWSGLKYRDHSDTVDDSCFNAWSKSRKEPRKLALCDRWFVQSELLAQFQFLALAQFSCVLKQRYRKETNNQSKHTSMTRWFITRLGITDVFHRELCSIDSMWHGDDGEPNRWVIL